MAKRYIVTGGTGLIGRALVAGLAREGHEVWVLSRSAAPAEAPLGKRPDGPASAPSSLVHRVHWDGKSAAGWGSLVDGAEAVVNLAGESIAGESLGAIALRRWTRGVKNRILRAGWMRGAP
ncbi:MAG: NAD-dependent epimerase/dehydratase family protein [Spirochaetes bacterium]|nr:NAD-dependent epimerase/dehydratase family protein [Spirochaetota bacterium]